MPKFKGEKTSEVKHKIDEQESKKNGFKIYKMGSFIGYCDSIKEGREIIRRLCKANGETVVQEKGIEVFTEKEQDIPENRLYFYYEIAKVKK